MSSRIAILVAFAALVACARAQQVPIVVEVGAVNREHLLQLRPGMPRGEVLELMEIDLTEEYRLRNRGFDTFLDKDALIPNPYRRAQIRTDDGSEIELLFYYTGEHDHQEPVTDAELTPLVLEDGLLLGWGWPYLNQNVGEYWLLVRRR